MAPFLCGLEKEALLVSASVSLSTIQDFHGDLINVLHCELHG